MSIPFSITSQTGQPASPAGGNGAAASQETGDGSEFASLLATLFALTAPGGTTEQGAANGEVTTARSSGSQFDLNLLGLTASGETGETAGKDGQSGDLLGDLLERLDKALEQLLSGDGTAQTPASGIKAEISKAIEALTALLSAANGAPQIQAGQDALLSQAAPGSAQTGLALQSSARLEKAMARLQDLANSLAGTAPQLAEDADKLLQRLDKILPKAQAQTAAATPQTPADSESAELAANISQLLGGRSVRPGGDSGQAGGNAEQARTAAATQKSETDLGKTLTDIAKTGTDAEKPVRHPAQTATATAQPATTPAGDSGQPDMLLQVQSASGAGRLDFSAVPKQMTAAYQGATPNLNLPHIAFEIASRFQQGLSRFQVRLDPPEMGKIDVRMDVDGTGNLHARLTVERPETLDLLQRDARALERALSQAGLDGARTNLEFSLKQNPFARQDGQPGQGFGGGVPDFANPADDDDIAAANIPAVTIYRGIATPGGVNMLA